MKRNRISGNAGIGCGVFKNAAILFTIILISVGCADSSAQSANQDGSRLVGTWVNFAREGGDTWVFNSDGTGSIEGEAFKYGAVAGKLVIGSIGYDFAVSNDGKTLLIIGGAVNGRNYVLKRSTGK